MGILRNYRVLLIQVQSADKAVPQLGKKMKRAAQKGNMTADRFSAGQSGDGLIDNSLKDRDRQIFLCRPFIDQRLDIGFREHTAACGNGIDSLIVLRVLVHACGIGLKKRSHLINKRSGSPGTDAVHPLLDIAVFKIDDFCVLAAELNGNICLRSLELQGGGDGNDLLDKGYADILRKRETAASGDYRPKLQIPQLLRSFIQKIRECFLNPRKMSFIIRKKNVTFLVQNNDLDCGRANINSQGIGNICHSIQLSF